MKDACLILGAGSSIDLGFPSGKALVDEICFTLDTNKVIKHVDELNQKNKGDYDNRNHPLYIKSRHYIKVLGDLTFSEPLVKSFISRLRGSGLYSIDAFLSQPKNKDFLELGKNIISLFILDYEQISIEKIDSEDGWQKYVWNRFNSSFVNQEKPTFNIITFNYDRSLEYFLFQKMKSLKNEEDDTIFRVINRLGIRHIHGDLGSLNPKDANFTAYGEEITSLSVGQTAPNLSIVHEKKITNNAFSILNIIEECKNVLCLGFGYHPDNLAKFFDQFEVDKSNWMGTCYGMEQGEQNDVKYDLHAKSTGKVEIELENMKIRPFLAKFFSKNDFVK